MAFAALNGYTVYSLTLTLTKTGAWTVRNLVVFSDTKITGFVRLEIKGAAFYGTVYGDLYGASFKGRMVGGRGKLQTLLKPRFYPKNVNASIVLNEIVQEAGEQIASTSDLVPFSKKLNTWTRSGLSLGQELKLLCLETKTNWRMLDDGTIYFGALPATVYSQEYAELDKNPEHGTVKIVPTKLNILPGMLLEGRIIKTTEHVLVDAEDFHTNITLESST